MRGGEDDPRTVDQVDLPSECGVLLDLVSKLCKRIISP